VRYFELVPPETYGGYELLKYRRAKYVEVKRSQYRVIELQDSVVRIEGDVLHLTAQRHYELKAIEGDATVDQWYDAITDCLDTRKKNILVEQTRTGAAKAARARERNTQSAALERARLAKSVQYAEQNAKKRKARGVSHSSPLPRAPPSQPGLAESRLQQQALRDAELTYNEESDDTTSDSEELNVPDDDSPGSVARAPDIEAYYNAKNKPPEYIKEMEVAAAAIRSGHCHQDDEALRQSLAKMKESIQVLESKLQEDSQESSDEEEHDEVQSSKAAATTVAPKRNCCVIS